MIEPNEVLIFPISVAVPTATTIPIPLPDSTLVPEKAIFVCSAKGVSSGNGSVVFWIAWVSPVRIASSICKLNVSLKRTSAETISPAANTI